MILELLFMTPTALSSECCIPCGGRNYSIFTCPPLMSPSFYLSETFLYTYKIPIGLNTFLTLSPVICVQHHPFPSLAKNDFARAALETNCCRRHVAMTQTCLKFICFRSLNVFLFAALQEFCCRTFAPLNAPQISAGYGWGHEQGTRSAEQTVSPDHTSF